MTFEEGAETVYDWATSINPSDMLKQQALLAGWGDYFNGVAPWQNMLGVNIEAYAVTGELLYPLRLALGQQTTVNYLDSNTEDLGLTQLHSQALLVSLMYANEAELTDWSSVAEPFLDALFNEEVAAAAGFDTVAGTASDAAQMMSAIAYSVIDEGTRVFGDSSVRALFNDADELGLAA